MTHDQLVETVKAARASIDSADEDVLAEVLADAILAEMAEEWNAACDAISEACQRDAAKYPSIGGTHAGLMMAGTLARALRRPDAAPAKTE